MARKRKTREKESILTNVQSVVDIEDPLTCLFYGRSGTGKTTVGSTFPKRILLIDIMERGWDSVRGVEGLDVIYIDTWEEFEFIYWALAEEDHEYQTAVIDTVTSLQELAINEAKRMEGKGPEDPTSRNTWGNVSGLMKEWLLAYRDLPLNIVYLGQERVIAEEDEDAEYYDQLDPEVCVATIPSVAKTLNGAVKVIGHTYIREATKRKDDKLLRRTEYRMRLGPHAYYTTKMRSPQDVQVPTSILNPSYEKLLKILEGGERDG